VAVLVDVGHARLTRELRGAGQAGAAIGGDGVAEVELDDLVGRRADEAGARAVVTSVSRAPAELKVMVPSAICVGVPAVPPTWARVTIGSQSQVPLPPLRK